MLAGIVLYCEAGTYKNEGLLSKMRVKSVKKTCGLVLSRCLISGFHFDRQGMRLVGFRSDFCRSAGPRFRSGDKAAKYYRSG